MNSLQQNPQWTEVPVFLSAGGKAAKGIALTEVWSQEERNRRAWKALGVVWGGAIFSIFLPLVHFVLVPGLLLLGPAIYFWMRQQKGKIREVRAACPFCEKAFPSLEAGLAWPLRATCPSCFERVLVEREPSEG